jgi:hypothetical protein
VIYAPLPPSGLEPASGSVVFVVPVPIGRADLLRFGRRGVAS